jgi:hypothetical protein
MTCTEVDTHAWKQSSWRACEQVSDSTWLTVSVGAICFRARLNWNTLVVHCVSVPGPNRIEFRSALYGSRHFEGRIHSRQVTKEINILYDVGNGVVLSFRNVFWAIDVIGSSNVWVRSICRLILLNKVYIPLCEHRPRVRFNTKAPHDSNFITSENTGGPLITQLFAAKWRHTQLTVHFGSVFRSGYFYERLSVVENICAPQLEIISWSLLHAS